MRRSTGRNTADRMGMVVTRATVEKVDNSKKMQEADFKGLHEEGLSGFEVAHDYGFTAVPLAPDGGGKAEAFLIFPTGNRSHGIAVKIGDRRYRPTDWKPGESGVHDHQQQKVHVQENGVRVASPDKAISHVVADNAQHRVQAGGFNIFKVQDLGNFRVFQKSTNTWHTPVFSDSTAPPDDPTRA